MALLGGLYLLCLMVDPAVPSYRWPGRSEA
jgi:hypothetical protein